MREGGRIVSVAAMIAVAANTDGRREIVGLHTGPSGAETFRATFLKDLVRRGLRGVKLAISDAHEGLKAAIRRVIGATWQRCRVHFARNARAGETWRHVADRLRGRWPRLGALMDDAGHDVLACMTFPARRRTTLHGTNPPERLNRQVKRRADVVGILPNEDSIVRLIGSVPLEASDAWRLQHRYMQIEGMAELDAPAADAQSLIPGAKAA